MDVSFNSSKNTPQMLFLLGGPGSGKGTQSAKLVRDLKYTHLSVGDLLRAETQNKSKEGQEIEAIQKRGDIVPSELTVRILLKAIKEKNAKKYIIDGFPRTLEQALCFEKNYREIDYIVNLHCPDEILMDRLLKRAATEGRNDDNPETIKNRLKVFHDQTEEAIAFYSRYGKVAHINGEGPIDQVYHRLLQAILPNLIVFYGPPASGQEQLAEKFANLTGYRLLKVKDFYKSQGVPYNNDEIKMDQLISFLRDNPQKNWILHGFPENIRQVKVFVEHFAAPRQFYYFDFTKDQVENNIKDLPKQQRQEILQEYDVYVKNRKDILPYFSKKPYFTRIQESDSKDKVWARLVETISPEVIACPYVPDDELSTGFIRRIEQERGYMYVDFNALTKDEIERGMDLGKKLQSGANTPAKIALLKRVLYSDFDRKKFIIGGFPDSVAALNAFESECCKVRNVIVFSHKQLNIEESNIFAHYHAQGKLIKVSGNHIDQFDDYVQDRCRYGFLIGPDLAGRAQVLAHLKGKYATQVVDFNQLTELLKVKLATEENPDVEVKFPDVLKYFKDEIASKDRSNNLLLDGWPYEKDQLVQFVKGVGIPNYVFYLNSSEEILSKRYILENKVEAVEEADLEKIKEDIGKAKTVVSGFHEVISEGNNINLFDVLVGISNEATLKSINKIIYKKVLVFRNQSIKHKTPRIKETMVNACITNGVTFVDVHHLVKEHIARNDELGTKLQSQAKMAGPGIDTLDPSHFTPTIITDLIGRSLQSQPATKYLMLYNYPNAESKHEGDFYPRAIDELHQIEVSVGPVKQVISVRDDPEDYKINDPVEEKPVIEEPVVETKAPKGEGEEGEAEPEPPKDEEGEETKPKFNPLDYNWTVSNANSKSLAKVYHRRPNCQHEELQISPNNLEALGGALGTWLERLEQADQSEQDLYVEVILS